MHLAAESHVDRYIDGLVVFIQSNTIGTYTLLETSLACWGGLRGESPGSLPGEVSDEGAALGSSFIGGLVPLATWMYGSFSLIFICFSEERSRGYVNVDLTNGVFARNTGVWKAGNQAMIQLSKRWPFYIGFFGCIINYRDFNQEGGEMKKLPVILGAMVFAFVAEGAMAACGSPSVQVTDIAGLLSGNTVCVGTPGNYIYQEEHQGSGAAASPLVDFKKGDGDPVDPRKQVGYWQIAGNTVSHFYTQTPGGPVTSGPFTFEVWQNSSTSYSFCGATTVDFTRVPGINVGCP